MLGPNFKAGLSFQALGPRSILVQGQSLFVLAPLPPSYPLARHGEVCCGRWEVRGLEDVGKTLLVLPEENEPADGARMSKGFRLTQLSRDSPVV